MKNNLSLIKEYLADAGESILVIKAKRIEELAQSS